MVPPEDFVPLIDANKKRGSPKLATWHECAMLIAKTNRGQQTVRADIRSQQNKTRHRERKRCVQIVHARRLARYRMLVNDRRVVTS